ncbi:hypothetical protein QWZ13_00005, partial [Reinekea marina]|uniref:hypothetical protein n=1 Tax=Reinekea marina TaxID=1310421 RepID=UPI0025B35626
VGQFYGLSAQINTLFTQLDPGSDQRARTEQLLSQVINSDLSLTQSELTNLNQNSNRLRNI